MFVEESRWLCETLARLRLEAGTVALDAGASTLAFRQTEQPHVHRNLIAPLRGRGVEVRSLDIQAAPGIDFVCDLTAPGFDWSNMVGRRFDLVLCNNVVVHLSDPVLGAANISSLVAPGGWLLASTPAAYRRVRDPLDNGLRPRPGELAALFMDGGRQPARFELVAHDEIRINQRSYYRSSPLRPSWFPIGSRWMPVPGVVEQVRYLVPRLRWRVSCVLLRRVDGGPGTGSGISSL